MEIIACKFKFFETPLSLSLLISIPGDNHGFSQIKESQFLRSEMESLSEYQPWGDHCRSCQLVKNHRKLYCPPSRALYTMEEIGIAKIVFDYLRGAQSLNLLGWGGQFVKSCWCFKKLFDWFVIRVWLVCDQKLDALTVRRILVTRSWYEAWRPVCDKTGTGAVSLLYTLMQKSDITDYFWTFYPLSKGKDM